MIFGSPMIVLMCNRHTRCSLLQELDNGFVFEIYHIEHLINLISVFIKGFLLSTVAVIRKGLLFLNLIFKAYFSQISSVQILYGFQMKKKFYKFFGPFVYVFN